jgi:dTDP-glucose pyrophosphorylase
MNKEPYLISHRATLIDCLGQLNKLKSDLNLFVVDENGKLQGSITDGDIRRGLVAGKGLNDPVASVMNRSCKFLTANRIDLQTVLEQRKLGIRILPIVDDHHTIVDLLNFSSARTLLPVDAVIMAGGTGSRLLPLTKTTPKPLLQVGGKPILAHNLDRLRSFGISRINITVNYLGDQIIRFAQEYDVRIQCVTEPLPLGTVGALTLVEKWESNSILLINSDLLTNLDYEDFFFEFERTNADMIVAAIPYPLKVPYAILETHGNSIVALKEKPEYTFQANTGIYLLKRDILSLIPKNTFFDATDLMSKLIEAKMKLVYYPMTRYWLDIGNHESFHKAQHDIRHLNLEE